MYETPFLLELYRTMLRIRTCEEALVEPIVAGEVRCPVHLCSGQEAVATGVMAALREGDKVFSNHRSHGHYLAKTGDLKGLVAEVFCRETGCCRGRGGSMHLCDPQKGFLGSAPIVAGTIALAAGSALASRVRGDDAVTVSFFGDGATGEGVFYESLNLAALWKLPVLFVCENNYYSTHLPIRECRVSPRIREAVEPFGVRTADVDGNDVLAVYAEMRESVSHCRSGKGPAFVECRTYRLRGHVGPDDNIQGTHTDIRPAEEVARWRARDPLSILRATLLEQGRLTEAVAARIAAETEAEVQAALQHARASHFPPEEELARYVFQDT
jgi:pyruvate dehydrogenase E1 component alpha subunit